MNTDSKVVAGFGDEWHRFDQSALSEPELRAMFEHYFEIFPWQRLGRAAVAGLASLRRASASCT